MNPLRRYYSRHIYTGRGEAGLGGPGGRHQFRDHARLDERMRRSLRERNIYSLQIELEVSI